MIYLQLFISFLQVGLFSIGGGYAALPIIQSEIVTNRGWLSINEFTDLVTIAGMTPGPVAINAATFVGIKIAGFPGALIATLGSVLPSIFIVSFFSFIYQKYKRNTSMQNILSILRASVVALIASAGLTILQQVIFNEGASTFANLDWIGIGIFAVAFFLLRKYKLNPILIMSLCGCTGIILYYL